MASSRNVRFRGSGLWPASRRHPAAGQDADVRIKRAHVRLHGKDRVLDEGGINVYRGWGMVPHWNDQSLQEAKLAREARSANDDRVSSPTMIAGIHSTTPLRGDVIAI